MKIVRESALTLDLHGVNGLSEDEAQRRLTTEGLNELPTENQRGSLAIALEVAREPMFLMLVAAGSLYLLMGEPADALMLLGFVFVVMAITIVQERRTERALDALRDLSSPRALVIRDGVHRRIAGREVVRGDLVVLAEGDRVPADGLLRRGVNLSADESLLTGESVPVQEDARPPMPRHLDTPGGDDLPSVFSGTLVTAGQGIAEVVATGAALGARQDRQGPAAGRTGAHPLAERDRAPGPHFRHRGARGLRAGGGGLRVDPRRRMVTRGSRGFLAGIAMAMATLPEEFPVVLTVFLALGAWRISRSQVLTRRMPAVETLGAATVLCVDKTGTLTQNRMTLRKLATPAPPSTSTLFGGDAVPRSCTISSRTRSWPASATRSTRWSARCTTAGDRLIKDSEHLHPDWSLEREYPLTPGLLAVSHAWTTGNGDEVVVAAKGAPEAIADLCHLDAGAAATLWPES